MRKRKTEEEGAGDPSNRSREEERTGAEQEATRGAKRSKTPTGQETPRGGRKKEEGTEGLWATPDFGANDATEYVMMQHKPWEEFGEKLKQGVEWSNFWRNKEEYRWVEEGGPTKGRTTVPVRIKEVGITYTVGTAEASGGGKVAGST